MPALKESETKAKLKEQWKERRRGRKHYNNGTVGVMCFEDEIPVGYVPGRIKWK